MAMIGKLVAAGVGVALLSRRKGSIRAQGVTARTDDAGRITGGRVVLRSAPPVSEPLRANLREALRRLRPVLRGQRTPMMQMQTQTQTPAVRRATLAETIALARDTAIMICVQFERHLAAVVKQSFSSSQPRLPSHIAKWFQDERGRFPHNANPWETRGFGRRTDGTSDKYIETADRALTDRSTESGPNIDHSSASQFDRWINPKPTLGLADAASDLASIALRASPNHPFRRTLSYGLDPYLNTRAHGVAGKNLDLGQYSRVMGPTLMTGYGFRSGTSGSLEPDHPSAGVLDQRTYLRAVDWYVRDWIAGRIAVTLPAGAVVRRESAIGAAVAVPLRQSVWCLAAAERLGIPASDVKKTAKRIAYHIRTEFVAIPDDPGFSLWRTVLVLLTPILAPVGSAVLLPVVAAGAAAVAQATTMLEPILNFTIQTVTSLATEGKVEVGGLEVTLGLSGDVQISSGGRRLVGGNIQGGEWTWDAPDVVQTTIAVDPDVRRQAQQAADNARAQGALVLR